MSSMVIHKKHLTEFYASQGHTFTLGIIEVDGIEKGFIGIKPSETIPREVIEKGVSFGNSVQEIDGQFVFHIAFKFYEFKTYHCLVQPQNPLVQSAFKRITETKDYCFLLMIGKSFISYMSPFEEDIFNQLVMKWDLLGGTICLDDTYDDALVKFKDTLFEGEEPMMWVCKDGADYLDINTDPFEARMT
jgi:hypothetical protein